MRDSTNKNAIISKRSDTQRYTIWDTIENSVTKFGAHFIVFIDEAHRGVEQKADREQATVINKIVNGAAPVPVIVGISATAEKFEKSIAGGDSALHRTARPVKVNVADVQRSGIIKDRIVLHNPAKSTVGTLEADTTLIRAGVQRVLEFEEAWAAYCAAEEETLVVPAIVIQVADKPTDDELREIVDAVLDEWPGLTARGFVNTFAEHQALDLGSGRVIQYMAPHHIQDQTDVRVVLAKNAITTGWDCPRAEVLVSLRTAHDHTYIAQLIGRTIRQPLARRIESNETLNKVACYLPRFDSDGVAAVINQFKNEGDDSLSLDVVRATVSYTLAPGTAGAATALGALPSYRIPSRVTTPGVRRLHRLATALTGDGVREDAADEAKRLLNIELDAIGARLTNDLARRKNEIESVSLDGTEFTPAGETVDAVVSSPTLKRDSNNIDDVFRTASRALKDGVAEDYWQYLVAKYPGDIRDHKVTVAALGTMRPALDDLDSYANRVTRDWLALYGKKVSELTEGQRAIYDAIRGEAKEPERTIIAIPEIIEEAITVAGDKASGEAEAIAFARADTENRIAKHLYVDETDGLYYIPSLNLLERNVLAAELDGDVVWYRNPGSGARSLTIPYESEPGVSSGLHPDFIVFRKAGDGSWSATILDPHGSHFEDAVPKLRGLSGYAALHSEDFRSILAIDRVDDEIRVVPMHDTAVRLRVDALLASGSNVKDVFKVEGVPL